MPESILFIALLGLAVGVASLTDDPDISSELSKTEQSPYVIRQRQSVRYDPLYHPANYRYSNVPIAQRQGVAQESESKSSNGLYIFLLYFVFSQLFTKTTTTAPTTTAACTVAWGTWTDCNLAGARYRDRVCPTGSETEKGVCFVDCLQWSSWMTCPSPMNFVDVKRTRTRQCSSGHEIAEEACHSTTTPGTTSDGWYRATNGCEYKFFNIPKTWAMAVDSCELADPRSTLAAKGARSGFIKIGIDTIISGIANDWYWVGGTDSATEDTWVFPDEVVLLTASISQWGFGSGGQEPNGGNTQNCLTWYDDVVSPIAEGYNDQDCNVAHPYLCERLVA